MEQFMSFEQWQTENADLVKEVENEGIECENCEGSGECKRCDGLGKLYFDEVGKAGLFRLELLRKYNAQKKQDEEKLRKWNEAICDTTVIKVS